MKVAYSIVFLFSLLTFNSFAKPCDKSNLKIFTSLTEKLTLAKKSLESERDNLYTADASLKACGSQYHHNHPKDDSFCDSNPDYKNIYKKIKLAKREVLNLEKKLKKYNFCNKKDVVTKHDNTKRNHPASKLVPMPAERTFNSDSIDH